MSTVVKSSAVSGPPQVILTGVGPRNPMGLPTRPMGAKTPPTPPQPMSAAVAYSTPVLPGPNTGGYLFLPSSPSPATVGQKPPVAVTPTPATSRKLPMQMLGGGLYQPALTPGKPMGQNIYAPGPAPTPPTPTTPANPNYTTTQMPIMATGSLNGG